MGWRVAPQGAGQAERSTYVMTTGPLPRLRQLWGPGCRLPQRGRRVRAPCAQRSRYGTVGLLPRLGQGWGLHCGLPPWWAPRRGDPLL